MAIASYNKKYLRMKPEVNQIFADLDEYLNFCRMQYPAVKFDEADLYRNASTTWQKFVRTRNRMNSTAKK